jgi:hypothetical protein
MANCQEINNTIKGTSAFIYEGTPLPCTDVNTCDGLNAILSKFDAIICDVTTDINTLIEDVATLTEEVIIATEDIVNIYTQLNICCPTTTTTTTLPITTTTSTSSSTTTTTTTIFIPCDCFQIFANDGDHVSYTDCNGVEHTEIFEGIPSVVPPYIGLNSKLYCVRVVSVQEAYFVINTGICELGSYCDPTTTTSTSSSTSTSTSTTTTTNTTLPIITCASVLAAGGQEVKDATVNLDPAGGVITMLFYTGAAPDKLEIYHGPPLVGGTNRVATSSMTSTTNDGVYDMTYGIETANTRPTLGQAQNVRQFIGSDSNFPTGSPGTIPQRRTEYTAATGNTIPTPMSFPNPVDGNPYQQVVWWIYTPADYLVNSTVTVRVTGLLGAVTGWSVYRWCPPE